MQHATSTASAKAGPLADQVQLLEQYRKSRAHLFPTRESLQWYLRSRKQRMVAAGAMFLHRGQWHVHAARFDAAIVDIGIAETRSAGAFQSAAADVLARGSAFERAAEDLLGKSALERAAEDLLGKSALERAAEDLARTFDAAAGLRSGVGLASGGDKP